MNTSVSKKRIGIKDVARAAGTSQTTVSRTLNNTGYPIKEELRQRILRAAKELDYRPNMLGRMLKSNRNRELGIIIPTIANPFYTQIILGMEIEARKNGYGVLLCNTLRSADIENEDLLSLFDKQIMGIAIASVAERHDVLRSLHRQGLKVVVIDQDIVDVEPYARIGFNYLRVGMTAAEKLIQYNHKNTAFLSAPLSRHSRKELLEGFRMGHARCGATLLEQNILIDETEAESGEGIYELECAKRLTHRLMALPERPDGIFVTNDMIAIGVLSELASLGVRVPEDISVVGFDNILISSMVSPPLTTIDSPAQQIGTLACRMLVDMLADERTEPPHVTLESTWIERSSVRRR